MGLCLCEEKENLLPDLGQCQHAAIVPFSPPGAQRKESEHWLLSLSVLFKLSLSSHSRFWLNSPSPRLYLLLIIIFSTARPQTISEIARVKCLCFSSPNLIECLIRSATQNNKQMDVAVGEEKHCVCQIVCSYGNSWKIACSSVCAITPLCLLIATGSDRVWTVIPDGQISLFTQHLRLQL